MNPAKAVNQLLSILMAITGFVALLTLILSHYPIQQQIIKFAVYIAFVFFAVSLYIHQRDEEIQITHQLGLLCQLLLVYAVLVVWSFRRFLDDLKTAGELGMQANEILVDFTHDYYFNQLVFCGMLILFSVVTAYFLGRDRLKQHHKVLITGMNIIMIGTSWVQYRVIFLIETLS